MSEKNKNTKNTNKKEDELDDLSLISSKSDDIEEKTENKSEDEDNDKVVIAKSKAILIKKLLANIKENSDKLVDILAPYITKEDEERISIGQLADEALGKDKEDSGETRVIEGVFDGENMIGPDGKQYSVPANYASKSKLIEGDILKLTITGNGTFIYKQICPIERSRLVGVLEKTVEGEFYASVDGKRWRVLTASVTYFKGDSGDEIVILVPKSGESKWAAVENIVKKLEAVS
jgi:hypothetical protein